MIHVYGELLNLVAVMIPESRMLMSFVDSNNVIPSASEYIVEDPQHNIIDSFKCLIM